MTETIAVIIFPGTNCELETVRACKRSGMKAEIVRWNDPDKKKLKQYDGYILPGGFAYEDRGRSGIIAAKEEIMETVKAEAEKGKPVLGICNGAQILVEAGMIPGLSPKELEMALAWNERVQKGKILGVGFYNEWIYMRSDVAKNKTAFNRFGKELIMKVPIAHGEGRFCTQDKELLKKLIQKGQTLFRYCNEEGKIIDEFPVNPNGAMYNLAGVCSPQGNVLALMPHPERTINGQPIFDSLREYAHEYIGERTARARTRGLPEVSLQKKEQKKMGEKVSATHLESIEKIPVQKAQPDIALTIELIITDNAERTIENTCKKLGLKDLKLKRKVYYGIHLKNGSKLSARDIQKICAKIIQSGEIINLNKEIPTITIQKVAYGYNKDSGLYEKAKENVHRTFLTSDHDNYAGKNMEEKLAAYLPADTIKKVEQGIEWTIISSKKTLAEKLMSTHLLHNPHSMKIVALQ